MYRTRLSRVEEKKNIRRTTLLVMATVGVLIAGVVLGIPILTRTAIFMGTLNSKNDIAVRDDAIPPGVPQISLSYDATNSATQVISGLSEPGSTVYLTHNSQTVGNVVTDTSGTFQFVNLTLGKGDNLFSAIAMDQAGNKSLNSSQVHLYYSSDPPELEVTSPVDHQTISDKTFVTLTGNTKNAVRLSVNDRTIILNSNGQFNTSYSLSSGENVLVFIVTDGAGNQTRKEMMVIYAP